MGPIESDMVIVNLPSHCEMKGKNVLNFFFEKERLLAKRGCTFNADERFYEIITNIDHVDAI